MYVDYFSGLVYQLQARSKEVRGMGSLFQAPRNLWAENLGERRTRAREGGDRRSQDAVKTQSRRSLSFARHRLFPRPRESYFRAFPVQG